MARKNRTTSELQEASNHLRYEAWMLSSLAQAISSGISNQGWLTNALLESFVIHVRGLTEFFYSDTPRNDDAIANDFFDSKDEWHRLRPVLSEELVKAKNRAGKEIAHLTYARLEVTADTKPWPFLKIESELSLVLKVFLENVPSEKLGSRWKPEMPHQNSTYEKN